MSRFLLNRKAISPLPFVMIFVAISVVHCGEADDDMQRREVMAELKAILELPDVTVELKSVPRSSKDWSLPLKLDAKAEFLARAKGVEIGEATSHCNWTHESLVRISTQSLSLQFFGTVCEQEPDVLVLKRLLEVAEANGQIKLIEYPGYRVKGLGAWIQRVAPDGAR